MAECPHHRIELRILESRAVAPDRIAPAPTAIGITWCSHPDAVVTRKIAKSQGGSSLLACSGELARCMLPKRGRT